MDADGQGRQPGTDRAEPLRIVIQSLRATLTAAVVAAREPLKPRQEQRAIAVLLLGCLLLPLVIAMSWSMEQALLHARVRSKGELPDVVALLGQNEPDVERLLGKVERTDRWVASAAVVAMPSAMREQTHPVVYGLPDLATNDARASEFQQFMGAFDSASRQVVSDAKVIVFFSENGRAVVVHLELDRLEAESLLGPNWLDDLPRRAGLANGQETSTAPSWSESDYGQNSAGIDRWGFADFEEREIGYHVHTIKKPPPGVRSSGVGAVSLTVGEGLLDSASGRMIGPEAEGNVEQAIPRSASARSTRSLKATQDFYERTFYAIVLGKESSMPAARRRANALNERASASGEASPAVIIEAAGHLQLANDDSLVIVYIVGYDTEADARRRASSLWWPLRALPKVRQVTKRCGEFTFSEIE